VAKETPTREKNEFHVKEYRKTMKNKHVFMNPKEKIERVVAGATSKCVRKEKTSSGIKKLA